MTNILNTINQIQHPYLKQPLADLNLVSITDDSITLTQLSHGCQATSMLKSQIEDLLQKASDNRPVSIEIQQVETATSLKESPIPDVKNVLAVGSGKGGVGKSTVTANLAVALAQTGAKVGILDADVYGPSIPKLFGLEEHNLRIIEKRIQPAEAHGVKIISMGFLIRPDESVIWRGPMLHGVIQQFIKDVEWGELDFLLVDLPPGTGDVSLSLSQSLNLSGSLIVSTPQQLAVGIATKAGLMFNKLHIPLLGVIENMSYYLCPNCNTRDDVFSHGGSALAAEQLGTSLIGQIPLNSEIRKHSDNGVPIVTTTDHPALTETFHHTVHTIARKLVEQHFENEVQVT